MSRFWWPQDTMAGRFAFATICVIISAFSLAGLLMIVGGTWARPPFEKSGLPQWAVGIIHVVEAAPPQLRKSLSLAATTRAIHVDWYDSVSPFATTIGRDTRLENAPASLADTFAEEHRRAVVFGANDDAATAPDLKFDRAKYPETLFLAVKLIDNSWIVFTALDRSWGLPLRQRGAIGLAILAISVTVVSVTAARRLTRPVEKLVEAVRLFGLDHRAPPIPESGPKELREVISAFNAMQAEIKKFLTYRTTMLAAISHDLRTPLTRIRLRGEFIEDQSQRMKLFRDVDEMQAMVDGALAFFRDDATEEPMTLFDLPGLLHTIANDYADQGIDIEYVGPVRASYFGRPFALKRAISNLVDNAIKYGTPPKIDLSYEEEMFVISVRDRGPGIPRQSLERVFDPFYRLDRSRNRASGGVGLGLTAAQNIIRGHGGDIVLDNRLGSGLEVSVTLPVIQNLSAKSP